jgi:hypothetical protein
MTIREYAGYLTNAKFWTVATVMGGIIFLLYYAHIGFLPELDIAGLAYLFIAAALTGAIFLFVFMVLFILPGFMWHTHVGNGAKYRELDLQQRRKKMSNLIWFGLPFLPVLGSVVAVMIIELEIVHAVAIVLSVLVTVLAPAATQIPPPMATSNSPILTIADDVKPPA